MYGNNITYQISLPITDDDDALSIKQFINFLQGMINDYEEKARADQLQFEAERKSRLENKQKPKTKRKSKLQIKETVPDTETEIVVE
jgi:hypothetical protein